MHIDYHWYDLIGNLGVVLILGTYLLMQLGRLSGTSIQYTGSNALGAACIIVSLIYDFNISAMIIECFWLGISIIGIVRAIRVSRQTPLG